MLSPAVATRADRCYAVDLDTHGEYMATGGRDKKIALYRYDAERGELELKWEKLSGDFVYAVALSDDMEFCALGGTDKVVAVYAARTGMQLYTIPTGGTIWALYLHAPPGERQRHLREVCHCCGAQIGAGDRIALQGAEELRQHL